MLSTQTADVTAIRESNLSLVATLIREAGTISRAEIVRRTHLSATTVSSLANQLLASGFVYEIGMGESSGGRPPKLLQFDYTFRHVLGVDLGATHIAVVVMDLRGKVVGRRAVAFAVMEEPQGALDAVGALAQGALEAAGLERAALLGAGVGAPAPLEGQALNRLSGIILPRWQDVDLAAELRARLGLPVYLENDANAGAIAEKWWGLGRAQSDLAFIKIGTGVGSGLIIGGKIYRGYGGAAGEIGHTTIDLNGPLCRCGNRGCLESFAGAPAVVAEVRRRRGAPAGERLTVRSIVADACAGEPAAAAVVVETGSYLGIAIANLLNLFNPGLVILHGDLVAAGALLTDAVHAAIRPRAISKAAQEASIAISELGDDAAAMGAATLVIEAAFQPSNLVDILRS